MLLISIYLTASALLSHNWLPTSIIFLITLSQLYRAYLLNLLYNYTVIFLPCVLENISFCTDAEVAGW